LNPRLEAKSIEAEESTHARYARLIERFFELKGAKAIVIFPLCKPWTSLGFVTAKQRIVGHESARSAGIRRTFPRMIFAAMQRLQDVTNP
jgi:hypothetical protein